MLVTTAGLTPSDCSAIFHKTALQPFRRMLPWIVHNRPDLFDAYQSVHSANAALALARRPFALSFVPVDPQQMLFAGIYAVEGWEDVPRDTVYADARFAELDLPLSELRARPAWDPALPPWRDLALTARDIRTLPAAWAARLADWRGIYLIVDQQDGARYVGSAYGAENLLGRWRTHVAGEQGVTKELRGRDPLHFRFSILERVSPDAPLAEVVERERSWMHRLDTIERGLNT